MASTAPADVAAASRASAHRPSLPGRIDPCPTHARRIITRSIASELHPRVMRELDQDARDGRHPGCHVDPIVAAVIRQLGDTFLAASESGRLPHPGEVRVFRVLGARCGLSGPDCDEILETLEAAAEAIHILVLCHATRHDRTVGEDAALTVCASLCGVIETVSRLAFDEFIPGFEAVSSWQPHDAATLTAFTRLLDGHDAVADYATPPKACDVLVPRAVAVLLSTASHDGGRLAAASHEVEVLVPHAVALPLIRAVQLHGRVVLEYRSRADWRQGRALIRSVADVHGLSVMATDPVVGLGRLRERYHSLLSALSKRDGRPPYDGPHPAAPAAAPCRECEADRPVDALAASA